MAEDVGKEFKRTNSYHRKICNHEKRAQDCWMAVVSTERKLKELRKENEHKRQMLAKVKSKFQPFSRVPCAPATPLAVHIGREVSGDLPCIIWSPRENQGSGVTCRFDSASPAMGSGTPRTMAQHLRIFLLK